MLEKNLDFGEIGAGMQLALNRSRLLDRLGILKEVHASADFPKQIGWMEVLSSRRLACIGLGETHLNKKDITTSNDVPYRRFSSLIYYKNFFRPGN